MDTVLLIHSAIRVAILVFAVIVILKFGFGWLAKGSFGGTDRGLQVAFSSLMDVQALFGLVLLLGGGFSGVGFPLYRIEHAVLMIIAVVVAHLPARWKDASDAVRYRNSLFAVIASLLLVLAGIASLGQRAA